MWKIKDLTFDSHVVLGPMAGYTFSPYRSFCKRFGVAYSVSEMVSDTGLSIENKTTLEYVKTSDIDVPFAIQLFGSKIENAKKAIDKLEERKINYQLIDLNFGCPVHKVIKTGAGSSWLKPERDKDLFEYVKEIVSYSKKPVTAKIRIGFDDNAIEPLRICRTLEKAGISAITVHARTAKQMYTGKARYELIENLGDKISVPLIISGDINDPLTAIDYLKQTKATAIMVARGGVGNPDLIKKLNYYFQNRLFSNEKITFKKQNEYAKTLSKETLRYFSEKKALNLLKHILPRFYSFFLGRKKITNDLFNSFKDKETLIEFLTKLDEVEYKLNPCYKNW